MRQASAIILVAALLSAASGCGTLANLDSQPDKMAPGAPTVRVPMPFGGVTMDMKALTHNEPTMPASRVLMYRTIALVDLPISLVGDVVTLPWVALVSLRHQPEMGNQTGPMPLGLDPGVTPSGGIVPGDRLPR